MWSTNTVSRSRNRLTMIASPTATSAAATAITKNTNTWPSSEWSWFPNDTNARFAALSISSTDMKMMMALRRTSTPTMPIVNRIALTASGQPAGITRGLLRGASGGRPGAASSRPMRWGPRGSRPNP